MDVACYYLQLGVIVAILVLAAVVLPVGLHVRVQSEGAHPDGTVDRALVDRGDADGPGVAEELFDAADGGDDGHGHHSGAPGAATVSGVPCDDPAAATVTPVEPTGVQTSPSSDQ